MNTININDTEIIHLKNRDIRVLIGTNSPVQSEYMTFGVTTIEPGVKMDPHIHNTEEEIIYILSGEGYVVIDGKTENLSKGTAIKLPIKSEHYIHNISIERMIFVFCFNSKITIGSYDKK